MPLQRDGLGLELPQGHRIGYTDSKVHINFHWTCTQHTTRMDHYTTSLRDENVIYVSTRHPGQLQRDKPDGKSFYKDTDKGM
jgi:hypothetical protein